MKICPVCRRQLHPLGYARHMAMHRDADRLLDAYKTKPDPENRDNLTDAAGGQKKSPR